MGEKKIFDLSIEQICEIKSAVIRWTDEIHPVVPEYQGIPFRMAFKEGSKELRNNKTFVRLFSKICLAKSS